MRYRKHIGRRFVALLGFGAALSLLVACSGGKPAADGPEHTIVIGHEDPTDNYYHETYERFKERVERESDGRIAVKIVPNELFGDMSSLVTAVQLNSIQMTAPVAGVMGQFSEEQNVWDTPYLFDDVEHARRVTDGEFGQGLLKELEDINLVGFGYWENGVRHLTTEGIGVRTPEDLNRVKIRVQPNALQLEAWSATSANPTPMAFGEVYTGLQQGTIDAQENPLSLIVNQRFYEVQDHVTLTGHVYSTGPLIMSKIFYDSLPRDLQEIVTEAAVDTIDYNRKRATEIEQESAAVIEEAGVEIDQLSEADRERWKETMQGAAMPYLRDLVGDETVDELEAAIEEERR